MGRKTLALASMLLGVLNPVLLQSLAVVLIVVSLAAVLIVYIALFNQTVCNRLIRLITAVTSRRNH